MNRAGTARSDRAQRHHLIDSGRDARELTAALHPTKVAPSRPGPLDRRTSFRPRWGGEFVSDTVTGCVPVRVTLASLSHRPGACEGGSGCFSPRRGRTCRVATVHSSRVARGRAGRDVVVDRLVPSDAAVGDAVAGQHDDGCEVLGLLEWEAGARTEPVSVGSGEMGRRSALGCALDAACRYRMERGGNPAAGCQPVGPAAPRRLAPSTYSAKPPRLLCKPLLRPPRALPDNALMAKAKRRVGGDPSASGRPDGIGRASADSPA